MAKRQTRKSISITGRSYSRLKEFCEKNDKTMSGVVEEEIKKYLDSKAPESAGY